MARTLFVIVCLAFLVHVQAQAQQVTEDNWYKGGNLHEKRVRDWRVATYRNKLATCADFVANGAKNKIFVPKVQNAIQYREDIKPYAKELVDFINEATAAEGTSIFVDERIDTMALTGMKLMGWYKKHN